MQINILAVGKGHSKFTVLLSITLNGWILVTFALRFSERTFEDHENLVEPLLAWTRDSENNIFFQERPEKNEVFKNPQVCPLYLLNSLTHDEPAVFQKSIWWVFFFLPAALCASRYLELSNIWLFSQMSCMTDGMSFFRVG